MKEFFIDQIYRYLNDPTLQKALGRHSGKTLIEINLDLFIRWYAQTDKIGKDTYGYNILGRMQNHQVSERALAKLTKLLSLFEKGKSNKKYILNEMKKVTHYEHNAPVDIIKKQLINLGNFPLKPEIENVLSNGYSVVILSKEEASVLGGMISKQYIFDGKMVNGLGLSKKGFANERMDAIKAELISKELQDELIKEIQKRLT